MTEFGIFKYGKIFQYSFAATTTTATTVALYESIRVSYHEGVCIHIMTVTSQIILQRKRIFA
jgi:hypothetical protein